MEVIVADSLARAVRQSSNANPDSSVAPWLGDFSYNLQLPGSMNPDQITLVTETIKRAISLLAPNGGIKIISGISFAANVKERIESLCQLHGHDFSAAEGDFVTSIHRYVIGGQSKIEIVMDEGFAWGLIDEEEEASSYALQWLLAEIGEAEFLGLLDQSFPTILQKRRTENHRETLGVALTGAIIGYFRMKCAGGSERFSKFEQMTLDRAMHLLIRPTDDVDEVFTAQLDIARDRLVATALYVALLANHSLLAKERQNEFEAVLANLGLTKWLPRWESELASLWERRVRRASFEEFHALNFHVERMLWQMQTVVWPMEGDRTYVYFM
jgi:hypothetical protein